MFLYVPTTGAGYVAGQGRARRGEARRGGGDA